MLIRQLLVDAQGCRGPLDDAEALAAGLDRAARTAGATVVERALARYVPHGVTAVVILAESHIILSTWPEHRLALVDVLLCNDQMDPSVAWEVLAEMLLPDKIVCQPGVRAVGLSTGADRIG